MRVGSLCSGIGGLELGVERATGAATAWQAEIDPAASAVLAEHWPDVPNIGDIRDLTAMTPVDILTAGYPCQPFSTAGRRKGTDDPRHLWPTVRDAIAHLGPDLVVLENVRGHLSLGFDRVLGDLADIGYDAEWRIVRASDVGCCHQRARLFVAAYPNGDAARRDGRPVSGTQAPSVHQPDSHGPRHGGGAVAANASDIGRQRGGRPRERGTGPADSGRPDAPDTHGAGLEGRPAGGRRGGERTAGSGRVADPEGERRPTSDQPRSDVEHNRLQPALVGAGNGMDFKEYAPAVRRQEQWNGPTPDPTTDGRLSPAFVEWMMGYPQGWTDAAGSRNNRLRCLGNAVVPHVAEAFCRSLTIEQAAA